MTSGIYKLNFSDEAEYIGKSINIEKRWAEHTKNMQLGKAAAKMQHAYKRFGLPTGEILMEVHPEHLDVIEAYLIYVLKPSLNTTISSYISQEDFELMRSDPQFLLESSADHIRRILVGRKNIEDLDYQVENLLEGYEVPYAHLSELWHAEARMHDAENALKLFKKLPWYKRIFI